MISYKYKFRIGHIIEFTPQRFNIQDGRNYRVTNQRGDPALLTSDLRQEIFGKTSSQR